MLGKSPDPERISAPEWAFDEYGGVTARHRGHGPHNDVSCAFARQRPTFGVDFDREKGRRRVTVAMASVESWGPDPPQNADYLRRCYRATINRCAIYRRDWGQNTGRTRTA